MTATELYTNGNLSTGPNILYMISNINAFFSRCIENFDDTAFWQTLAPLGQLLHTAPGKQWMELHSHVSQFGCNLALDIQDILVLFRNW
jgi:hypothetical protein